MTSLLALSLLLAPADESLKDKACRSVHLGYPGKFASAFYNEVTVRQSAPGTYFCAIGWDKGYFGIQELDDGKHLAIFSVWDDDKENDPKAVPDAQRVKLIHQGKGVRIGRFGGEGTGGQSFFDLDWKKDQSYGFLVTAKPDGKRTEYAGYLFDPKKSAWFHMVTFSTITGGKKMSGFYSFVEDFKRDGKSAKITREALFSNAWITELKEGNADWKPVLKAKFTGDKNPVMNVDARMEGTGYILATGGDITNKGTPLFQSLPERPAGKNPNISSEFLPKN